MLTSSFSVAISYLEGRKDEGGEKEGVKGKRTVGKARKASDRQRRWLGRESRESVASANNLVRVLCNRQASSI